MAIALKAENVSIRYITGDFKDIGLKEYTVRKLTRNYHVKEFMAVDGVSFALEKGDMLGIIGSNGAGKSTLLKAVAGIMEPTRGKITTQGEVAALLELGSGFDGDLTVKENAYLRGAMLGYTKDFMDQTYDQIIDFAELREFEDRPFKQLSSGMKSRLAFSIASLVNPDILILDEVLSVGDGAFQEKSAKKMREIIGQGATTILVSHSLSQIRELCNKVLWLDHGKQVAFGETEAICNQYEKFLRGECPAQMPDQDQMESAKAPQAKEFKSVLLPEKSAVESEQHREKSNRIASVEGLRGIMALIIALFHFGQVYPIGSTFHRGYFAVEVFFMLSGFLLAKKLEKAGRQMSLGKDLTGRLKRLYPAYFVSVLALVMLYSAVWFHWNPIAWIQSEDSHLTSLIAELLCIQVSGVGGLQYVNGPVWYVSALLLSTVIIILLFKLLPTRFFKVIIAGTTVVTYGLFFAYDPFMNSAGFFNDSIVPSPLLRGVAGLGLGCCLYWIYHRYKDKLGSLKGLEVWAVISCYLLVLPMIWTEPGRSNFLLFIPASICILTMFWLEGKGKFPILTSRPVQYLGKISYTFFVMQSFSQNVVSILISKNIQNHVVLNVIYLALNLLLSTALFLALELPRSTAEEKKHHWNSLERVAASAILALFCAVLVFNLGQKYLTRIKAEESVIEITAEKDSGTVVFRGAYVDGNWISPADHVSEAGAWVYDGDQAVYTAVDETPLTFLLPAGSERTLIFYSGPDAGKALINVDGTQTEFDFWSETSVEQGWGYQVPSAATPGVARQLLVVALLVFIATFILCLALYREPTHAPAVQREVWQDILRTVCCFVIVLLHCTCNVYKQFGESLSQWAPHMLMSCFTAFAVPCFYMISGASLLRREHSVKETWRKRIPQSAVPLLFWSVLYIFLSGDVRLRRFVDVLFREQWPHLWFMYCILGIYALLPLLSVLYQKLDTRGKVYLLIILLFVPSFLHDAEYMANAFVDMPKFAVFWPDLGLFFWGAFLWEQRERLAKWVKWYPLSFVGGLGLTAVCTTYASLRDGVPNQNFISCIASIGVLAMATSLFGFCMAQEDKLRRTAPRLRNLTAVLASVSFGIYLIHPMVMTLCGNALSNHGSLLQMVMGAAIYFILSASICVSGKHIRGVERII